VQRLEIVARACELVVRPNETPEDGKTTRTIEELMDEVIRRGIVPDISWSSVLRILAGLEVKPLKTEPWFHSPDPEFRPKVTAICDLYLKPPPAPRPHRRPDRPSPEHRAHAPQRAGPEARRGDGRPDRPPEEAAHPQAAVGHQRGASERQRPGGDRAAACTARPG
jgi:hypothetical protein